jgi:hypothetical protein
MQPNVHDTYEHQHIQLAICHLRSNLIRTKSTNLILISMNFPWWTNAGKNNIFLVAMTLILTAFGRQKFMKFL